MDEKENVTAPLPEQAAIDVARKTSPTFGKIILALSKAQASFDAIEKDKTVKVTTKTGGSYSFQYSTLDAIVKATKKGLTDNSLAHTTILDDTHLTTILAHESGEFLSSQIKISSLFKAGDNNAQAYGSAITYGRRYLLSGLLGIVSDEDDDGNSASGNQVEDRTGRAAPGAGGRTTPLATSKTAKITDKQLEFGTKMFNAIKGEKEFPEFLEAAKKLVKFVIQKQFPDIEVDIEKAETIEECLVPLSMKEAEAVISLILEKKEEQKAAKAAAKEAAPAEPTGEGNPHDVSEVPEQMAAERLVDKDESEAKF